MAMIRKWDRLSRQLKEYKQNVLRTVHYSGGKFKSEKDIQDINVVSSVPTRTCTVVAYADIH
jgi:hypothetical protein